MPKRGKNYREAAAKIEKAKLHEVSEAMGLVVETSKAKFDETIEAHVKLGVDGRHADQQVRGAIVLPNGTVLRLKKLKRPELITLEQRNWLRGFSPRTGSTLM